MTPELPLVSVVISNYNYEMYLADAVESCFAQDYPNIEVIVVDDVSTDNSIAVAERVLANRPNSFLIKRLVNGGQGAALLDGFRVSTGDYVVFLDADDVLFRDFAGAHVYTHLALQQQVAFTSSQLVHIGPSGRLVTGSSGAIRKTFLSTDQSVDLQLLYLACNLDEVLNKYAPIIGRCIYLPPDRVGYHWAPCSGLFFKRSALEQIAFDDVLRNVRVSADFYFTLTHYFNGSAVIDAKLGGYRIHGKNSFSGEVHLDFIDDCRRMPEDLFTGILQRFARYITGPGAHHYSKLLGAGGAYPRFLNALEHYSAMVNRKPGADPRIFSRTILDQFNEFANAVGKEFAIHILRDHLGVTEEELRYRKIV